MFFYNFLLLFLKLLNVGIMVHFSLVLHSLLLNSLVQNVAELGGIVDTVDQRGQKPALLLVGERAVVHVRFETDHFGKDAGEFFIKVSKVKFRV